MQIEHECKENLIDVWYERAAACQKCHYLASARYTKLHYYIGIPLIILAASIGTTSFINIKEMQVSISLIIGIGSMCIAVFSGLQTFLGLNEKSEKHQLYGARYGSIGRKLEVLRNYPERCTFDQVEGIKLDLDKLALEAPKIPLDILAKVKRTYKNYEVSFGPIIDKV